jgi:hypothetical protein
LSLGASRENLPLFALRRDQQNGFDRPSPQGPYNAVHADGLPETLVQLNVDVQSSVPYSDVASSVTLFPASQVCLSCVQRCPIVSWDYF